FGSENRPACGGGDADEALDLKVLAPDQVGQLLERFRFLLAVGFGKRLDQYRPRFLINRWEAEQFAHQAAARVRDQVQLRAGRQQRRQLAGVFDGAEAQRRMLEGEDAITVTA